MFKNVFCGYNTEMFVNNIVPYVFWFDTDFFLNLETFHLFTKSIYLICYTNNPYVFFQPSLILTL